MGRCEMGGEMSKVPRRASDFARWRTWIASFFSKRRRSRRRSRIFRANRDAGGNRARGLRPRAT